jgi:hypothetical protein
VGVKEGDAMTETRKLREPREQQAVEEELDWELEQTFPASAPPKMTRSALNSQVTPKAEVEDEVTENE